jgi:hypothetical protein
MPKNVPSNTTFAILYRTYVVSDGLMEVNYQYSEGEKIKTQKQRIMVDAWRQLTEMRNQLIVQRVSVGFRRFTFDYWPRQSVGRTLKTADHSSAMKLAIASCQPGNRRTVDLLSYVQIHHPSINRGFITIEACILTQAVISTTCLKISTMKLKDVDWIHLAQDRDQ